MKHCREINSNYVENIEVSKVVEVDKTVQKLSMGSKQQHGLEEKIWPNMLLKNNKELSLEEGEIQNSGLKIQTIQRILEEAFSDT